MLQRRRIGGRKFGIKSFKTKGEDCEKSIIYDLSLSDKRWQHHSRSTTQDAESDGKLQQK